MGFKTASLPYYLAFFLHIVHAMSERHIEQNLDLYKKGKMTLSRGRIWMIQRCS